MKNIISLDGSKVNYFEFRFGADIAFIGQYYFIFRFIFNLQLQIHLSKKETVMNKHEQRMPRFFICSVCGNMVEMHHDSGNPLTCCGKEMVPVTPGTDEDRKEKHIPVCEVKGQKVIVKVGSEPHPMTPDHHICWIMLVTDRGTQKKPVYPSDMPMTCFHIGKHERVTAVYEYCNLHGLWLLRM